MLNEAIIYAMEKHKKQRRKGTNLPYIVHPLAVMSILQQMGAGEELLCAGVLHDTLEDTDATEEEIRKFGDRVYDLVKSHTDDKSLPWRERKEIALANVSKADSEEQMLVLADKLANIRDIERDYKLLGDKLWTLFREPYEQQKWYYHGGVQALRKLYCEPMYQEFAMRVENVFGIL